MHAPILAGHTGVARETSMRCTTCLNVENQVWKCEVEGFRIEFESVRSKASQFQSLESSLKVWGQRFSIWGLESSLKVWSRVWRSGVKFESRESSLKVRSQVWKAEYGIEVVALVGHRISCPCTRFLAEFSLLLCKLFSFRKLSSEISILSFCFLVNSNSSLPVTETYRFQIFILLLNSESWNLLIFFYCPGISHSEWRTASCH